MSSKRPGQRVSMTSINELLCLPETEGTIDVDVNAIYPFENHPFKVMYDNTMEELVESIKLNGVLTPVLLRPDGEGNFEMISGHRRLKATKLAGLRKIPAIIKEMTDDEATIAMVDANMQREEVLPSEKAFALKMKMNAIKNQGKRHDLTSSTEWTKLRSGDIAGRSGGIGKSMVHRYIRLTELDPKLLDMVDRKRLAINSGVEISYLNKDMQQWIYDYIKNNGMIKQEQLMELRQYRGNNDVTQKQLINLLDEVRIAFPPRKKIVITERRLNKYFPKDFSQTKIEEVIIELLNEWKQDQEGETDERNH